MANQKIAGASQLCMFRIIFRSPPNWAIIVDFSFQIGMAWSTGYSPLYVLTLADAVPLKNQYQQKNSCDFWMLIFFWLCRLLVLLCDTSHTVAKSGQSEISTIVQNFKQTFLKIAKCNTKRSVFLYLLTFEFLHLVTKEI